MLLAKFIFVLSVFANTCHAGQLPLMPKEFSDALRLPQNCPQSNIPQFILDTDHAWLDSNKEWLACYPNVRQAVCSKDSSLWTKSTPLGQTLPEDLFNRISIDNNKAGINRKGWENAAERLRELKNCPAALRDTKHLWIYIYVPQPIGGYPELMENPIPALEVPEMFAHVLESMPNLERLDWGIPGDSALLFEKTFAKANVLLPRLKILQPWAWNEWLVKLCPNLEVLEAGRFFYGRNWQSNYDPTGEDRDSLSALIKASKWTPVKKWSLYSGREWDLEKLEVLLDSSPNITALELDGAIKLTDNEEKSDRLQVVLDILARFPKLESLRLPYPSDLGLGFDGGAGCGNAYEGEEGHAYGRTVVEEGAQTIEMAAEMVTKTLPGLKEFRIGHVSPKLNRTKEGGLEMVWPWTGRMKEYTYEAYPL